MPDLSLSPTACPGPWLIGKERVEERVKEEISSQNKAPKASIRSEAMLQPHVGVSVKGVPCLLEHNMKGEQY